MATITKNILNKKTATKPRINFNLLSRYIAFAEREEKMRIVWYFKTLLILTCGIMIPTVIAMAAVTTNYLWFVGLSILLFYANMLLHVSGAKSRFFVPFYHTTIALMVLIPLVTYLIG